MEPAPTPETARLEDLYRRFRARGDAAALAAVFDRTAATLLRIALHLAPDAGEAEDLVQATFVTAIEARARFDPERPLLPWLAGILAAHERNAQRRRRTRAAGIPAESAPGAVPRGGAEPVARVLDREVRAAVERALAELPERERALLRRHLLEGASGRDLALETGAAPGTMRKFLFRAIERLRGKLPRGLAGSRGLLAVREAVLARAEVAAMVGITAAKPLIAAMAAAALVLSGVLAWRAAVPAAVLEPPRLADGADAPALAAPAPPPAPAAREVAREVVARRDAADAPFRVIGRVVDDATGAPLAGAAVWVGDTLHREASPPGDAAGTAADGNFAIESATPFSRQAVLAWPAGFALLRRAAPELLQRVPVLDVGELRVQRGARVAGRVLDSRGTGVADAAMFFHEIRIAAGFWPASAQLVGHARGDGSFELPNLPWTTQDPARLYAVSPRGIGCAELDLVAGLEYRGDVAIRLFPPAGLRVVVRDAAGLPLAGVRVAALPFCVPFVFPGRDQPTQWQRDPRQGRGAALDGAAELDALFARTTDAGGAVEFDALPLPRPVVPVVVRAAAPGLETAYADRVEVAAGPIRTIELVLHPSRVRSIRGRAVTESDKPLQGAAIGLYSGSARRGQPPLSIARSGADGEFEFAAVDPRLEAPALAIDAAGIALQSQRVQFAPGEDQVEVVLRALPALATAGKVVDQHGAPVAGARALLLRESGELLLPDTSTTAADGAFSFADATAGTWTLKVHLPGAAGAWETSIVRRAVEIDGGPLLVNAVRAASGRARVEVEIVEAATGRPLPPAAAACWKRGESLAVRMRWPMDRHLGRATAERLYPGAYTAEVACDGFPPTEIAFDVAPEDDVVRVRLPLARAGRVRGRVLLPAAAEAGELVVAADRPAQGTDRNGAPWLDSYNRMAQVDAAGEFRFVDVAPGTLRLWLRGAGVAGMATVEIAEGRDSSCEIAPVAAGTLAVRGHPSYARGSATLDVSDALGDVRRIFLGQPIAPGPTAVATLPAGPVCWELSHDPALSGGVLSSSPIIASGILDVRAGFATILDLPGAK